jgi:hypothetical protein
MLARFYIVVAYLFFVGCSDDSASEDESQIAPDARTQSQMSSYGAASGEYGGGYGGSSSGGGAYGGGGGFGGGSAYGGESNDAPAKFAKLDSLDAQAEVDASTSEVNNQATGDGTAESPKRPATNRKLIYTTTVNLVVEDMEKTIQAFTDIINQADGFVASNRISSQVKTAQSGQWVIRLPVDAYKDTLQQLEKLGHAENVSEQASDVTEEFVDTEARLINSKRLEERIIKLLEDRSGKLSDILEIERELARVRETIERIEGRLRFLADKTSLATITLNIRIQANYQPPATLSFANRISTAWSNSLGDTQGFLSRIAIGTVSTIPWLLLWMPFVVVAAFGLRRLLKRSA